MDVRDKLTLGFVVSMLIIVACDDEQPPALSHPPEAPARQGQVVEHIAQPVLARHLDAYMYGDVSGALQTHIASTPRNTWCVSRSFTSLLDQVQRSKNDAACKQAVVMTSDPRALDALEDEELLMLQTMRFVCERPDATCEDYARGVYRSSITHTPYWSARLERYEIKSMSEQGEGQLKAYVDLEFAEPIGQRKELVIMERVDGAWVVSQGLESLPRESERE